MDLNSAILKSLADGRFHSGQALAAALGLSRTAVWKRVAALQRMGLRVHAVRGRGYRLAVPAVPLDPAAIRAALPDDMRKRIASIEVLFETDSTNQILLDAAPAHGRVVLAEYQRSGRGRRGNRWLSPLAGGICLSIGWHFSAAPDSLVLLSLLTGAAVSRALAACGCGPIGLKWPNDLVCDGRKLGGILIESRGQIAGPVDVVIGVGLNVRLSEDVRRGVDQPIADLAETVAEVPPRNDVAAAMIGEIVRMLAGAGTGNWDEYMREWRSRDVARGKAVRLLLPGREVHGTVEDVDSSGLLLLRVNGEVRRFSSGELSMRVAP
jgi:BirA family biotin operon repressor/biotin-[acetyl-CoA-carboxylase] ligase